MGNVQLAGAATATNPGLYDQGVQAVGNVGARISVCGRICVIDGYINEIKKRKNQLSHHCCLRPWTTNLFRGMFGVLAVAATINQIATEIANSDIGKRYAVMANVFDGGLLVVSNIVGFCWANNKRTVAQIQNLDHQVIVHYRLKKFLETVQDYFDFRTHSNWRRVEQAHHRLPPPIKKQYHSLEVLRQRIDAAAIPNEYEQECKGDEKLLVDSIEHPPLESDTLLPSAKSAKKDALLPALNDWILAVKAKISEINVELLSPPENSKSKISEINQFFMEKLNKLTSELVAVEKRGASSYGLKARKITAYAISMLCVVSGCLYFGALLWSTQESKTESTHLLLTSKICFIALFASAKAIWDRIMEKEKELEAVKIRCPMEIDNGHGLIEFLGAIIADQKAENKSVDEQDPGKFIRHISRAFRELPPHLREHLPDLDVVICKRIERYHDRHPLKTLFLALHQQSISQSLNRVDSYEPSISSPRIRPGLRPLGLVSDISPMSGESTPSNPPPQILSFLYAESRKRIETKWTEFETAVGAKVYHLTKGNTIIDRPGESPRLVMRSDNGQEKDVEEKILGAI